MDIPEHNNKNLQWHPAFFAGIQIELADESEHLIFENEHQLGTKPFGIDVLIIKKDSEQPIHKNIGRIFRKHNIIEYKSPTDYLSVDDFYKVYGYTCFYKADTKETNSIRIDELTISLVTKSYPRKLIQHLKHEQNYIISNVEPGIYYVIGDKIPIQIIVTKDLSAEENLWLKSLTDQLPGEQFAQKLFRDYEKHQNNILYQSTMNIIVQANQRLYKEDKNMCEALLELAKELMQDELIERDKEAKQLGENLINNLNQKLADFGRINDIIRASKDKEYQNQLIKEFNL